jgi:hypothetical protein
MKYFLPVILGLLPSLAGAIQITDYLDPESSYEEAFVLGQFNSKSGNQDQTSYDLALKANYEKNYSSLPRSWRFLADGSTDISRGSNRIDKRQERSFANLHANIDTYLFKERPVFWFGSGDIGYLSDAKNEFLKFGIGIGYGRVINATPLARLLRVEDELREHGIVLGRISDLEYLDMARIVAREDEFRSRYGTDEYKAYWFEAVEKQLQSAGVLKTGQLGALGALQMNRVLSDEAIKIRKHGWSLRTGLGLIVQDFQGNHVDPSIDVIWEYAKPQGYRGQFINTLSYSKILTNKSGHLLKNDISYTWEISDLIDWENRWNIVIDKTDLDDKNTTANTLSSSFNYYITNRISADATVSATKTEDNIDGNDNDATDIATFIGIRYRLK